MVGREEDAAEAPLGVHEGDQRRVHVLGQIGRVGQVEVGPLEHVLHEQRLVGMAHVGADHRQSLEVDQDVLEQLGVLAGRAHARAGDADVDRDGQPSSAQAA